METADRFQIGPEGDARWQRVVLALALLLSLFCANVMAVTITLNTTQKSPPDLTGAVLFLTAQADAPGNAVESENQPAAGAEIAQRNRQFAPYITVVQTGTEVTFPNQDNVAHHVYSFSSGNAFEWPLYAPGDSRKKIFSEPGLVTIGCNIHDWMLSYLLIVDTPYYGFLEDNRVEIADVPPGKYRMSLWYPGLKPAKPIHSEVRLLDEQQTLSFVVEKKLRKLRSQPNAVVRKSGSGGRY